MSSDDDTTSTSSSRTSEATKRKYTGFHFEPCPKHNRDLDDRAILKGKNFEKAVPHDYYSATGQSIVKHKPMKHKKIASNKVRAKTVKPCKTLVPTWTVQSVKQKLQSGEVITCEADKLSKTFPLYSICKRLKTKAGETVREFFFCTSCCSVLNVNLSTHYNQLKRHYEACTRIKIKNAPRGTSIQITVDDLCYLIERLTSVGSKHGRVESEHIDIPLIINAHTRKKLIKAVKKKARNLKRQSKHRSKRD